MTARRDETGTVTAETAMVLPVFAAFVLSLIWLISVGYAQVRVIDAARDAARAVARGESDEQARALAQKSAPHDAITSIARSATTADVTVRAAASPPGWLFIPLPALTVDATASVELEDAPRS